MEHVPFCSTDESKQLEEISLLPLFPSWSVVCVGSSRIYNHSFGLRNQPNFKPGYLPFLLPWDVYLTVKTEQWQSDVNLIHSATNVEAGETGRTTGDYSRRRQRRFLEEVSVKGTNREKVKVLFLFFSLNINKFSFLLDLITNVHVVIVFLFNHLQKH